MARHDGCVDCVLCHLLHEHRVSDEHLVSELVRFHRHEHAWGNHEHEHESPECIAMTAA